MGEKGKKIVPYKLRFLIDVYTFLNPEIDRDSSLFKEFIKDGIIEETPRDIIQLTKRGLLWLELILSVPYPKQAWVDSRGALIVEE